MAYCHRELTLSRKAPVMYDRHHAGTITLTPPRVLPAPRRAAGDTLVVPFAAPRALVYVEDDVIELLLDDVRSAAGVLTATAARQLAAALLDAADRADTVGPLQGHRP